MEYQTESYQKCLLVNDTKKASYADILKTWLYVMC